MKRLTLFLVALSAVCLAACARQQLRPEDEKVLVVYFSATGTTEGVARQIAEATGADLLSIRPAKPYTVADLDWNNDASRSSREMTDAKSRPAIAADSVDVSAYDKIYLGFPIWWGAAPRVVNTFIESHDLEGKSVIPFATSGGSGIGGAERSLQETYPNVKWGKGSLLNHATKEEITKWVNS